MRQDLANDRLAVGVDREVHHCVVEAQRAAADPVNVRLYTGVAKQFGDLHKLRLTSTTRHKSGAVSSQENLEMH
ncbi:MULTISPECIES: hypothetical protein [Paraburkholderia]|uniref:hypothetical protein n=1 Tax=Paraburkholderia TaxID=1822464 RepID=UPI0035B50E5E